jgi:hypothetical protein
MSTSATQSGTTTRAGRSGKGLGIAAAALAVVIAAGFVFAINQGNDEVTVSASERAAQIASDRWDEMIAMKEAAAEAALRPRVDSNAELDRLNELAASVQGANSLDSTTPSYLRELNEFAAMVEQARLESHPAFNIEKTKMELAGQLTTEHPGVNPEKTRMDLLIDKLDEQIYVPGIVLPSIVSEGTWSQGNLDLHRAQAKAHQPTELNQPEWDNRMP